MVDNTISKGSGLSNNPFRTRLDGVTPAAKDEWEDWSDDDEVTPIVDEVGEKPLIDLAPGHSMEGRTGTQAPAQIWATPATRQSIHKMKRFKSRHRQKMQNAQAGIKLDTDMSKFRMQRQQQQQHVAQQLMLSPRDRQSRTGKFVDAAALKALEGDPSSPSIGSFAWLKKKPKDASKKKTDKGLKAVQQAPPQDLSPNERPIMIGFELPAGSDIEISPQTAVVATPVEFPSNSRSLTNPPSQAQPVSAWSPDTEDGRSVYSSRAVSSIFSHGTSQPQAPPVPAIPAEMRERKEARRTTLILSDDEDAGTPITLFEESPTSPRKTAKVQGRERAPTDASTRSQGWWDHVTTPFRPSPVERLPLSAKSDTTPIDADHWWKFQAAEKAAPVPAAVSRQNPFDRVEEPSKEWWEQSGGRETSTTISAAAANEGQGDRRKPQKKLPVQIVVHAPPASSVASTSTPQVVDRHFEAPTEKAAAVLAVEDRGSEEQPPPYEPPSRQQMVRYRAVFPPGHHLNNLYPPSPGPVSPGLTRAMTSQGGIDMADVPLTPPPVTNATHETSLPDRPAGAFISGDHFLEMTGNGPRQKAERQRRRHEKEDAVARKVGGLWKGRGCLPAQGCYGRAGREGRKRRRICLAVAGAVIGLIILIVVLAVTLTRPGAAAPAPYSPWLNLTDFPPMPTGILTVVAPDNSDAVSGCVNPATLWSCSLPKEQTLGNKPYAANQPKFVFQIQHDNNTRRLWDVPAQSPPRPTPNVDGQGTLRGQNQSTDAGRNTSSESSGAAQGQVGRRGLLSFLGRQLFGRDQPAFDPGFLPSPAPPAFQEMWFLGNTSDGIVADNKAGEPTPFYITLLPSVDSQPIGPNSVSRRDGISFLNETLPPPALNQDGTGAPAVLLPRPIQQPLRLYDRGLPTEHYGFYSYFDKTMYAKVIAEGSPLANGAGDSVADQDGGALESEANFLVTWGMSRFKIEFWTRLGNNTQILNGGPGVVGDNSTRPGTFPYPIAMTVDTHGGQGARKNTWAYNVTRDQHIDTSALSIKLINYDLGGDRVNPASVNNTSFGGFDGGVGGCKCVYKNFRGATGAR